MKKRIYKKLILMTIIIFFCGFLSFNSTDLKADTNNNKNDTNITVIAHRGIYFNEPENSLKAIEDSIKHKVDYVEIDVQETSDGVVVLMHDKSLRRLTGVNKTVDELSYRQVEELNISRNIFNKKEITRIPTLNDVIQKCNNKVKLIIEIKPYGNTEDLTNKVVGIIRQNNFEKKCLVHSLSYNILCNVKRIDPEIRIGYIMCRPVRDISLFDVDFYSVRSTCATKGLVNIIHRENKQVFVWTVDNQYGMQRVIKLKADGIITDRPSILINKRISSHSKVKKL
ncbi:glycerophosphodiester phosphodiesterase [Clostridium felsineum]|uniref:glycerophosphodiester phosphodiesterase n=1 Tax=Clostridium felsineum TaxID=36839 RepID=UPI00214DB651|nr:glycerophosphodiester phosphodiesterase [Clostridium felsineum]MCR3759992.1 glycerophosphodiester phosphodiesterase [Clostridium felsineum]